MSGTRRTPIDRPPVAQVTPKAVELFAGLERVRRARRRAVDCTISEFGLCTTECRACKRWFDLHAELHAELRLMPWQWPCLPRNPYPSGSAMARDWRPDRESAELWGLLNEARRAAVVRSSRKEEGTNAEPAGQEPSI